jgi:hypothetical protein
MMGSMMEMEATRGRLVPALLVPLLVPALLVPLLVPLLAVAFAVGCGTERAAERQEQQTTMLRGDRQRPRAIKAAENRPHPWDRAHRPLEADRLDLEPYIARQRAKHREEHSKQVLVMESFSHPACSGLAARARRGCPVLEVRWGARRRVDGGVALVASAKEVAPAMLHRRVLCHIAFGGVHASTGCPLHVPRVRATTRQRGGEVILTIVTDDAAAVTELRRRVERLVP